VVELVALKERGGSVGDYPVGEKGDCEAVLDMPCEIWVPAARPDVVRADNVERLHAKLVVQGANIPVTGEAEAALHARGILSIPDFIANAGGVICAAVEYHGGNEAQAFQAIADKVGRNTERVLDAAKTGNLLPRGAAAARAERCLRKAMALRRWS
jgi:glutamate dehydrogenase (NAD(P)+)